MSSSSKRVEGSFGFDESSDKPPRARVWRACETCRKRKVKCDGEIFSALGDFYTTKEKETIRAPIVSLATENVPLKKATTMPPAPDISRHAVSIENRLGKVEETLKGMLPMMKAFEAFTQTSTDAQSDVRFPFVVPTVDFEPVPNQQGQATLGIEKQAYRPSQELQQMMNKGATRGNMAVDSNSSPISASRAPPITTKWSGLTEDSNGSLRYVGGASSHMLYEALESLGRSPISGQEVQLPFFAPHRQFRSLKSLPKPEDVTYPSAEEADHLVHTYFSKIHHIFPILQQQLFLDRYTQTIQDKCSGRPSKDAVYLACLFAVFACGSSVSESVTHDNAKVNSHNIKNEGHEYYERAQVLLYIGAGSSYVEHIQCVSLLALCSATWHSLAHSWLHSRQAVARAQDLGLHRSCKSLNLSPLQTEIRRRVWWCVYGLDRLLSISLGRPMAIHDDDCNVEFPAEVDDTQLIAWCDGLCLNPKPSYMSDFVALMRLYTIAGGISRTLQSPQMDDLLPEEARSTLEALDRDLSNWMHNLPDKMRISGPIGDSSSLYVIALYIYHASVINLHRPFVTDAPSSSEHLDQLAKCLTAARAIIRIGDISQKIPSTSHHLAFAVQYLTVSAVILIRSVHYVNQSELVSAIIGDVEKVIGILSNMQKAWAGSKRCREIVSDLLVVVKTKLQGGTDALHSLQTAQSPGARHRSNKRRRSLETEDSESVSRRARIGTNSNECFDPDGMHGELGNYTTDRRYDDGFLSGSPSVQESSATSKWPDANIGSPYQSYDFQAPQISLDLDALSSGHTIEGLPYSGYDFLGNDLFALLDNVTQPSDQLNSQNFEQNAEALAQVLSYADQDQLVQS